MKRYIDATKSGCIAIYAKDEEVKPIEIVQAGTTIYSMPIKDRKDYLMIEEKSGVFFIFDGCIPQVDFYAVPRIDIFARDNQGGYFGTIGNISDLEDLKALICYIDINKNVFKVANCMREFIFPTDTIIERIQHMKPISGITLCSSLKEANERYEFLNIY